MKKTSIGQIRLYYRLTKPGIIYGNLLTAIGGFLVASRGHVNIRVFAGLLLGISLVIASACVFNNVIDRDIDRKMTRTKNRAIVIGLISIRNALIYAVVLGVSGFLILSAYTNALTVAVGLIAIFSYVALYGLAKRRTVHGTLVGTIPGAASIVAGYTAALNRLDAAVLLLFLILVFWQMAHFYSIAIYRLKDYQAANIPVLPAKKGVSITKAHILAYIGAFMAAIVSLSVYGYSSAGFAVVMSIIGMIWLYLGVRGFSSRNNKSWSLQMFKFSLIVILGMSIMLSLDAVI